MSTIQVAIGETPYSAALRDLLKRNGGWDVICVETPDLAWDGVVVLDADHLERMAKPIRNPDRVVLIAGSDPQQLSKAWEAGVNSVIFDRDPLNTAVLAIMAAGLRTSRPPCRALPAAGFRSKGCSC